MWHDGCAECWAEITSLQAWASSVALNRHPRCPGWPGDGQDPGASNPVQYQQQHTCSATSRIYLLECKSRGYGPRGGGGSVFVGKGVSQFRNESLQSVLFPLSLRGGWWLLLTHFAEDTKEVRKERRGQTVTPRLPLHPWPAWSTAPVFLFFIFLERSSLHTHVLL